MNKLFCALFFYVAVISCKPIKPAAGSGKERVDKVCDSFMQTFARGNTVGALQLLRENSAMDPSTIDTLQATIENQVTNFFPAYGKIRSSEFIVEKKVKDFIAKRFYVLKFDKYYLKFNFTLYNNGTQWIITDFLYNQELIELLY